MRDAFGCGDEMAEAKGHKFGQTLGEWCERAIEPLLQEFADRHGLYLDKHGVRVGRKGRKVRWLDGYGNAHDLDYVLERGGSDERIGTPVAIIESAWRRYTKHSRNKAQEIQGAVLPVRDHHHFSAPFLGCILAGVYTGGALSQLRSLGFNLLHFDYPSIVKAFNAVGIDARFDERTTDAEFAQKQLQWDALTPRKRTRIWKKLLELKRDDVQDFMSALERAVGRQISAVRIIPLHGVPHEYGSIGEAIEFVSRYDEDVECGPILKYEVQIRYDSSDRIDAQFQDRRSAIAFLEQFRTGNWSPVS